MIAALLTRIPSDGLEVAEVPAPTPRPGEVLVELSACGICGTDLHIMAGESYRPDLPFVLGHELVGTVVSAGDELSGKWVGRKVAATPFQGCGSCPQCRSGDERLCKLGPRILGVLGCPGGFASQTVLAASQLVEVPTGLADVEAASLVDAGATAWNAVRSALACSPNGEPRHLVLGAGPVGLLTAEMLQAAGKRVEAVELNPLRREVLASRGLPAAESLAGLQGTFNTVIDCAGSAALVQDALQFLEPHGVYVSVGYAKVPEFDLALVARRELSIKGVRSGRREDLEAVIALAGKRGIQPPPAETWPLAEINDALQALRKGRVGSKAVIVSNVSANGSDVENRGGQFFS